MRHQTFVLLGGLATALIVAAPGVRPLGAQGQQTARPHASAGTATSTWTHPRTPWGDPDLEGIWPATEMLGVPVERPKEFGTRALLNDDELARRIEQVERQVAQDLSEAPPQRDPGRGNGPGPTSNWAERGKPQRQNSFVVDPPDGRVPPMLPQAQARIAAFPHHWFFRGNGQGPIDKAADMSTYDRCITRGPVGSMLPAAYNVGVQIVQSPGYVTIVSEMIHEARVVPLDGRAHVGKGIKSYMGDARGRWEGTTLVVESTNVNGLTGISDHGRDHYTSDALTLTERFTRVDDDTMQYRVTIDDPKTWTRPWTIAFPMKRDPKYGMFEYACHEGNESMRHMLAAARAAEASAVSK